MSDFQVLLSRDLKEITKKRLSHFALEFLDIKATEDINVIDARIEFLRKDKKLTVFQRTELGFNVDKNSFSACLDSMLKLVKSLGSSQCSEAFVNIVESLKEAGYEGVYSTTKRNHFTAGIFFPLSSFLFPLSSSFSKNETKQKQG